MSNKQRWLLGGGVAVVVVLLLFGFSSRANRLAAAKAWQNMVGSETMHVEAEITLNLPERRRGRPRPFTRVVGRVEGDVKRNENSGPELTGNLRVEASGKGTVLFAAGEGRILHDSVAFKLHDLPILFNPSGSLLDKWTYVDSPLLQTREPQRVGEAGRQMLGKLSYQGRERLNGETVRRFESSWSEEEEQQLAAVWRREQSGNLGLDAVARLLEAHKLKRMTVWVGASRELRRVEFNFVRPLQRGGEFDFATLSLTFTDYGKKVTIDRPERQLTVGPRVFVRLFGTGDVEAVAR